MTGVRARGEEIRRFIIENVEDQPKEIALLTSAKFGITRQAANKHLQRLVAEKTRVRKGKNRSRSYSLHTIGEWDKRIPMTSGLSEDVFLRKEITASL